MFSLPGKISKGSLVISISYVSKLERINTVDVVVVCSHDLLSSLQIVHAPLSPPISTPSLLRM